MFACQVELDGQYSMGKRNFFTSISLPPPKSSCWLPMRRIGWRAHSAFPLLDHTGLISTRNTAAYFAPVMPTSW